MIKFINKIYAVLIKFRNLNNTFCIKKKSTSAKKDKNITKTAKISSRLLSKCANLFVKLITIYMHFVYSPTYSDIKTFIKQHVYVYVP